MLIRKTKKEIMEWIKKCPVKGKTYFFTNKAKSIITLSNKDPVCLIYINERNILYEKDCGIDCSCINCKKLRLMLRDKEKSGEIYLSGSESDKRKIRGESD